MGERIFVGVDIGGTSIKMAFVTEHGDIIKKWQMPTNKEADGAFIPVQIAQSLFEQKRHASIAANRVVSIGVGAPAFIDGKSGFVFEAINIGWRNFPLQARLEEETGLAVALNNDANVAALGEAWQGAGRGTKHLLCLTLGTGLGGGFIANGRLVEGSNGMAGEIGHYIAVKDGGVRCNCGKTGCLETIASATGIVRLMGERLQLGRESLLQRETNLTAKAVFQAAEQGDECAKEVVDVAMEALGLALANVSTVINPEKIIIGGGVSKAGKQLLAPLQRSFKTYSLRRVNDSVTIGLAELGNDAGVIGAAYLAKERLTSD